VTENQVLTELTSIFHEIFGDDTIRLTPETTAEDIDRWDSFNHINILVASEMRFGIKFQTAEVEGLRNVGHLVELIAKKT
jgi:acyl carrier protein